MKQTRCGTAFKVGEAIRIPALDALWGTGELHKGLDARQAEQVRAYYGHVPNAALAKAIGTTIGRLEKWAAKHGLRAKRKPEAGT